jgi:AhpC/TSA antioxidant enzyme
MHCREHVVQLHHRIDDLKATGAEIVVIGNGSPSFIDGFREETGWRGPIYVDPSLEVYKAAGLKRGVLRTFSPAAALRSIGTLSRGVRQGRTQGDPWQQGGVLVISRSGDVLWSHASAGPGDNASAEQILSALRAPAA